jgi:heat shock protein HtpX
MTATGLRTHIWNNAIKSVILLAMFPLLVALLVYAGLLVQQALFAHPAAGRELGFAVLLKLEMLRAAERLPATLPWAALGIAVWFVIAWFANASLIALSTGARSVSRKEQPELYNLLENLCISRGRTMPKLRIIQTSALNAYASGIKDSQYTVTVTTGLLETLDRDEVEAVLAHELAHIEHGDVRLMMVATVFVGIFSLAMEILVNHCGDLFRLSILADSGKGKGKNAGVQLAMIAIAVLIVILVRVLSLMTQMAISRTREYMADGMAVVMTRNPDAMVSALAKISGNSALADVPSDVRGMFIQNEPGFFGQLFSTHPPISARIARLQRFGGALAGRRPDAPRVASGNGGPWSHP